jgi:UDP-glucose 4-epimerase
MKVIIIGSKGFIGQNLFAYFQGKGYDVWGADVVVDYYNAKKYFLIDASKADYSSVFQYMEYDICVNCSGAASVPESIKNPIRDYFLNTVNVFKLLEAIKEYQPGCNFINLSSAAVYGNPKNLPVRETDMPDPLSPYGIHKLQAEQICREFYDFYNIPTCSLRIFSVYGEGQKKQLFWDLYKKANSGKPFTLYGTGNESRDYIHIQDLVTAIERVAECSDFKADIVNIANGEEIKIKDATSAFFNMFRNDIKYSFSGKSRKGDPANWKADVHKLNSFGYKPSIDIVTGLKRYYEWMVGINAD